MTTSTINFIKTNRSSLKNIWSDRAVQTRIFGTTVEGKVPAHSILAGLDNYDPQALLDYRQQCINKQVQLGEPVRIQSKKFVGKQYIFFPIKRVSGDSPKASALMSCLHRFVEQGNEWNVTSVATHPMGCGSTDVYLSWEEIVYPMFMIYFKLAPISVTVYGAVAPATVSTPVVTEPVVAVTSVVPSIEKAITPRKEEDWMIFHNTNRAWFTAAIAGIPTNEVRTYVPAGEIYVTGGERGAVLLELLNVTQNTPERNWHDLQCVITGKSSRSTMVGDVFLNVEESCAYQVLPNGCIGMPVKTLYTSLA